MLSFRMLWLKIAWVWAHLFFAAVGRDRVFRPRPSMNTHAAARALPRGGFRSVARI
jgi:hypothetical protein